LAVDPSSTNIPFLRDEDIRRWADDFREKNWGERIPVDVELIAERNLKLLMIPVPDLRSQIQADAFLSNDLKEILYDPRCPDVRVRFSIAHEIAHLVLHSDVIASFRPGSLEEWKEMQRQLPETLWGRAEYQAREFAGRLLVPVHKLIEVLKEFQPLIVKAKQIMPDLEQPVIKDLLSPKLAKRFHVSDEVIARRMDAEGISPIQ
jgi:Zn-dependent peptidase ImmA (M78 family)